MHKFIKPAHKGLIVRHPRTKGVLAAEGELVLWKGYAGRYWRRRVKDGSVLIITKKEPETTSKYKRKKETN